MQRVKFVIVDGLWPTVHPNTPSSCGPPKYAQVLRSTQIRPVPAVHPNTPSSYGPPKYAQFLRSTQIRPVPMVHPNTPSSYGPPKYAQFPRSTPIRPVPTVALVLNAEHWFALLARCLFGFGRGVGSRLDA